ncbi:ATP-binding protein [Halomonas sp. PGE1]|uniref:ATP-binding protein n=1 Tax=Halomonas sp. PGE1 TaxID=2730360 RepID=UPI001B8D9C8A|nr:ATP-binding protein [Halomonas sp. PGE1]
MTMPETERLDAMLTRLKLSAIRERLDTLLDEAARRELTLRETLAYLCEQEVAHKEQRRIQMGLSIARFPFLLTLEGFEFSAQPAVDPGQIRELVRTPGRQRRCPAAARPAGRGQELEWPVG